MRWLVLSLLLLLAMPAEAATLKCRGFAFGYAEFTCEEVGKKAVSVAGFCDVMNRQGGAFLWSEADTYETKARADTINAAGKKLCGWQRPVK